MSLTIPSTFRTQIAQSIDAKDDGNCAERHQSPVFSLEEQIDQAENDHIAACLIVDILRDELAKAIEFQCETRRKVTELRKAAVQQ